MSWKTWISEAQTSRHSEHYEGHHRTIREAWTIVLDNKTEFLKIVRFP